MFFKEIGNFFSYEFVRNAFFVGILISIIFSFLSPFLVLKNCSLLGHSLSEVGFATFAVASALNSSPMFLSIPIMVLVSFLIIYFGSKKKNEASSLIAVFSTAALAVGITVTSLNKGFNPNVYNYMFGSVFSVNKEDLLLSLVLVAAVFLTFLIFYNKFFLIMFDEDFAKSKGFNITLYKFLISVLISITTVLGIKMIGSLLVSGFMIFPVLISKKIAKSFKKILVFSALFSAISFIVGFLFSLVFCLPTGAGIVLTNVLLLILLELLISKTQR